MTYHILRMFTRSKRRKEQEKLREIRSSKENISSSSQEENETDPSSSPIATVGSKSNQYSELEIDSFHCVEGRFSAIKETFIRQDY